MGPKFLRPIGPAASYQPAVSCVVAMFMSVMLSSGLGLDAASSDSNE